MRVSPFRGYNRWNWTAYCERDHFGDARTEPARAVEERRGAQRHALPGGPIFLAYALCYLGYVFNPVSFYYCYDCAETVETMMAEVNSTFGETHNYWLDASNQRTRAAAKRYTTGSDARVDRSWTCGCNTTGFSRAPGERLVAHMNTVAEGKALFRRDVGAGAAGPWERRELHRVLAAYPLMTLRVIGAIHWEAVKLWAKGCRCSRIRKDACQVKCCAVVERGVRIAGRGKGISRDESMAAGWRKKYFLSRCGICAAASGDRVPGRDLYVWRGER